jgi:hypothetical protein
MIKDVNGRWIGGNQVQFRIAPAENPRDGYTLDRQDGLTQMWEQVSGSERFYRSARAAAADFERLWADGSLSRRYGTKGGFGDLGGAFAGFGAVARNRWGTPFRKGDLVTDHGGRTGRYVRLVPASDFSRAYGRQAVVSWGQGPISDETFEVGLDDLRNATHVQAQERRGTAGLHGLDAIDGPRPGEWTLTLNRRSSYGTNYFVHNPRGGGGGSSVERIGITRAPAAILPRLRIDAPTVRVVVSDWNGRRWVPVREWIADSHTGEKIR